MPMYLLVFHVFVLQCDIYIVSINTDVFATFLMGLSGHMGNSAVVLIENTRIGNGHFPGKMGFQQYWYVTTIFGILLE